MQKMNPATVVAERRANSNLEELKKYVLRRDQEVAARHKEELGKQLQEAAALIPHATATSTATAPAAVGVMQPAQQQ